MKTYVVLLTQLLAQGSAHDDAADAGGGAEVRLPRLAPGAGNAWIHHRISKGVPSFSIGTDDDIAGSRVLGVLWVL